MMGETMEALGDVIKTARLQTGMTRKELAAKMGITARYLGYIENNIKRPSTNLLFRLVDELSIHGDSIFPEHEQ